jgi:hypothetical protein
MEDMEVKLLGVVFDQNLRFKRHIARAGKRGINAVLALKRIKRLTPKIARQLFMETAARKKAH